MKFDVEKMIKYYELGRMDKLQSIAYGFQCNETYISEEHYENFLDMINKVIDIVYIVDDKEVQESLFDLIRYGVLINHGKCDMSKCIERIIEIINSGNIDSYELGESLLIVSTINDMKYWDFLKNYLNSPDEYIKSIIEEFVYDNFQPHTF